MSGPMPCTPLRSRVVRGLRLLALLLSPVLAGLPARGQCTTVEFYEDFESGASGWSLSGDWGVGPMNCTTTCIQGQAAHLRVGSSPNCLCDNLGYGGVFDCEGALTSPWIQLPALAPGDQLELFFCADLYKKYNCFHAPIDDCHRLTLRAAGGGQMYLLLDGDDWAGSSCPGPLVKPPFDLSAYAGQSIQLVFEGGCVDSDGGRSTFNVDDVLIVRTQFTTANYCTSLANSTGVGAVISHSGSTSVQTNDLLLHADAAPPGQVGLFVMGAAQAFNPFGNGLLCVGGSIDRLLPVSAIATSGKASKWVDNQHPMLAGKLLPGTTWNFQFWFRDPLGGGAGFNLSDGLSATFCP